MVRALGERAATERRVGDIGGEFRPDDVEVPVIGSRPLEGRAVDDMHEH